MARCVVCGEREAVRLGRCTPCVKRLLRVTRQAVRNINTMLTSQPIGHIKRVILIAPNE
jgi:hypothetical protein